MLSFSIMLCIFSIFMLINLKSNSKIFGVFAGLVLLTLGVLVFTQGFMVPAGYQTTINDDGTIQNVTNVFIPSSVYFPSGDPFYVIGLILMMVGVYILISNALNVSGPKDY